MEQIKALYLAEGWFTFKEKSDIDLVLEKPGRIMALEIETGKNKPEQTQKNIEKLIKFDADTKLIICANEMALAKSKTILAGMNVPGTDAIQIVMARDFLKSLPE